MTSKEVSSKINRQRLVTWSDPLATSQATKSMSGLELLEALVSGHLPPPPLGRLIGFRLAEVSEGSAIFTFEPGEEHYNPIGTVHGGVASTLLDSATGCAIHSTLPAGKGYTTLDLKVSFVRPITVATGPMRCEATILHRGRRVSTAEGKLFDARDRLYSHGTCTCLIF